MNNINLFIFLFILYKILSEDDTSTKYTTEGLICSEKTNDCAPDFEGSQISKDECDKGAVAMKK